MNEDFMIEATANGFIQDKEPTLCIFTKPHHVEKIVNFLNSKTAIKYFITTDKQETINFSFPFDVGVSYCCPYKLDIDARPFYNYHPAPLPEYKGLGVYADAIKNNVTEWGVTLHRMTNEIDEGKIIEKVMFPVDECCSTNEIGTQAHAELFKLFRRTIHKLVLRENC